VYDPRFSLRSFDALSGDAKVAVLTALLEALILADSLMLRTDSSLPFLYDAGVRYEAEELGDDDWRDVLAILDHAGGDCEDLASWRVADLRVRLSEPSARPHVTSSQVVHPTEGPYTLYHIQVLRADGSVEDPSKLLGMP
jgi:hypothetical protein